MKKTLFLGFAISITLFSACKKHGCTNSSALNYSKIAKKDDGSCILRSDIKAQNIFIENFTITFSPTSSTSVYTPAFNYQEGDALIIQVLSDNFMGEQYWTPLPYPVGNDVLIWNEYNINTGAIWIFSTYLDSGNAASWNTTTNIAFKAVLIKKDAIKANPNIVTLTVDELETI